MITENTKSPIEPKPSQTANTSSPLADDQQVCEVNPTTGIEMGDNNVDFLNHFAHHVQVGNKLSRKASRSHHSQRSQSQ